MRYFLTFLASLLFQTVFSQVEKQFAEEVEYYTKLLRLPAYALGISKGDSIVFFKSDGYVTPESKEKITKDHMFDVASVTKTFTSVALQQLEAEGKLALTDKLSKFPNKYFTTDRWTSETNLGHIISHTSESEPVGTNFVYNGSKYNTVFNAFNAVSPIKDSSELTRPFTREIENRILFPLKMKHTLTRYVEKENADLKKWVVTQYAFDRAAGEYKPIPVNLVGMECGPGYGMISSVQDLVTFSNALGKNVLLPKDRYQKITTPFYPGSPQGMGCFSMHFEGVDLHWGYGYGSNSSALLLRIPSKDLTLVFLSPTGVHSDATRLGFGDPLNSPIAASFVKNYVLGLSKKIDFNADISSIEKNLKKLTAQSKSRIYLEQAYATVLSMFYISKAFSEEGQKGTAILKMLITDYPNDKVLSSASAFELIASLDDKTILGYGSKMTSQLPENGPTHPSKLLNAGMIEEKLGNQQRAIAYYNRLAKGDSFKEQSYKFDAMMKLAKHYQASDVKLSDEYLERLIRYKEYISAKDGLYNEAKKMLSTRK